MSPNITFKERKKAHKGKEKVVPTVLLTLNVDTMIEKYIYLSCIEDPVFKADLKLQRTHNFKKYIEKIGNYSVVVCGVKYRVFSSLLYSKGTIYSTINPELKALKRYRKQYTALNISSYRMLSSKHSANVLAWIDAFKSVNKCYFKCSDFGNYRASHLSRYVLKQVAKDLTQLGIGLLFYVDKKKQVVKLTWTYNPVNIALKHKKAINPTNTVSRVLVKSFGYELSEAEAIASNNLIDTKTLYEIKLRHLNTNSKRKIYSAQAYLRKVLILNAIKKGLIHLQSANN